MVDHETLTQAKAVLTEFLDPLGSYIVKLDPFLEHPLEDRFRLVVSGILRGHAVLIADDLTALAEDRERAAELKESIRLGLVPPNP